MRRTVWAIVALILATLLYFVVAGFSQTATPGFGTLPPSPVGCPGCVIVGYTETINESGELLPRIIPTYFVAPSEIDAEIMLDDLQIPLGDITFACPFGSLPCFGIEATSSIHYDLNHPPPDTGLTDDGANTEQP